MADPCQYLTLTSYSSCKFEVTLALDDFFRFMVYELFHWCAATKIDQASLLTLPCDILVPAAIGGVITEKNADDLQCKFVVEAANGPTTPEGDLKLRERGITVLPDIYTNGGKPIPAFKLNSQDSGIFYGSFKIVFDAYKQANLGYRRAKFALFEITFSIIPLVFFAWWEQEFLLNVQKLSCKALKNLEVANLTSAYSQLYVKKNIFNSKVQRYFLLANVLGLSYWSDKIS